MINDTKPFELTSEDIAWVSMKINTHYAVVKKSTELTEDEKQVEIQILVQRALRFGLDEVVARLGYIIFDIPLEDRSVGARLVLPKDYTPDDLRIITKRLELMKTTDN